MVRVGRWFLWIGALVAVVSIAVGVTLAVVGFGQVADQAAKAVAVGDGVVVELAEGDSMQLYIAGTQDHVADTLPECTVNGPAPTAPGTTQSSSFTYRHSQVSSFDSFRITTTGDYRVACDADGVLLAEQLSLGGIFSGVGGVLLAVFGGGAGVLLALIGLVLRIVGRGREVPPPPTTYLPPQNRW